MFTPALQKNGSRVAHIPLTQLRTIARHRDNKKGKPKVLSFIALNNLSGPTKGIGYQSFIVKMPALAQADNVTQTLSRLCQTKAQAIQTARERGVQEGKLARLPGNSERLCKVGWS